MREIVATLRAVQADITELAVDAAAAEQRAVRRVHDGVDVERRDVGHEDVEAGRADFGGEEGGHALELDLLRLNHTRPAIFAFAHDLIGKPVSTFRIMH